MTAPLTAQQPWWQGDSLPSSGVLGAPLVRDDYGTVSSSQTIKPSSADAHLITLGANVTLTLSSDSVPDRMRTRVYLAQDATGSRTVTWSGVTWLDGFVPTLQTAANSLDVFEFTYRKSAATWIGRNLTGVILNPTTVRITAASHTTGFATRITGETLDRIAMQTDRMVFGNGTNTSDVMLELVDDPSDGYLRQFLTVSRNKASAFIGIQVRNQDTTANSSQGFSGLYSAAQNGAGGYYRGSLHTYGDNYNLARFRGYTNVSNDAGNGLILRSIHATTPNVRIFSGTTGDFTDQVVIVTPNAVGLGYSPTGSNQAASAVTISGPQSTGNATPATLSFQTTHVGSSGSTAQTLETTLQLGDRVASVPYLLDLSTATAGQVKFPATQNPSTDVNTLDDYEEGSWTPTIAGRTTAGTQTYALQYGRYLKIGRWVMVEARMVMTAKDAATAGDLVVSGFPFASIDSGGAPGAHNGFAIGVASNWDLSAGYTQLTLGMLNNNSSALLTQLGDAVGGNTVDASTLSATAVLAFSGCYITSG